MRVALFLLFMLLLAGCVPVANDSALSTKIAQTVEAIHDTDAKLITATPSPKQINFENIENLEVIYTFGSGIQTLTAFSPSKDILYTGGSFGVYAYDVPGFEFKYHLPIPEPILAMKLSSDGNWLLVTSKTAIYFINTQTETLERSLNVGEYVGGSLAISPDASLIAFITAQKGLKIYRTRDDQYMQPALLFDEPIYGLRFGDDGTSLVALGLVRQCPVGQFCAPFEGNRLAYLRWRILDGSLVERIPFPETVSAQQATSIFFLNEQMALSPDEQSIAWCSDGDCYLSHRNTDGWDEPLSWYSYSTYATEPEHLTFSPDSQTLVYLLESPQGFSGESQELVFIDANTGAEWLRIKVSPGNCMSFNRTGELLAFSDYDGNIQVIEWHEGTSFSLPGAPLNRVGISPSGEWGILQSDTEAICIDLQDGQEIRRLPRTQGHNTSFALDDHVFFAQIDNQTIGALDCTTGELIRTLEYGDHFSLALSPDQTLLAVGGMNFDLFRANNLEHTRMFPTGFGVNVRQVQFSPDGTLLVGISADGSVLVIRLANGSRLLETILSSEQGDFNLVRKIALAPDNQSLAVLVWSLFQNTYEYRLHLYHISDGALLNSLQADSFVFSPNGSMLVTSNAGRLEFRQPDTLGVAYELAAHALDINDLVFSPAGDKLITVSDDGTAFVWGLP